MKQEFNILIADKNPHVREFLKREMIADGYRVHLAQNAQQLLKWVYHHKHLDLLIIDPDFPDTDVSPLLRKLQEQFPFLPVVVHAFLVDDSGHSDILCAFPFVEKQGGSIEHLKKVVSNILHSFNHKHNYGEREIGTNHRNVNLKKQEN
ncbi:response regulator [Thermodesulfobacteriota bacterium]